MAHVCLFGVAYGLYLCREHWRGSKDQALGAVVNETESVPGDEESAPLLASSA